MAEAVYRQDSQAILEVEGLHVYYGSSHALQGVDITLGSGAHAVLGRNGMGKTTLCNAIMGLLPASQGSIHLGGEDILGEPPHRIASLGVGYTPQGRLLWPSLTVDEHLRLCSQGADKPWNPERIYTTFPHLAKRRNNGGAQLSGGEQQMLAISRALLSNPRLLLLDEPTEGLAPVVVGQVTELLQAIAAEGDVAILLVEQNVAVANAVAKDVAIMVNGRIVAVIPAHKLKGDRALQQQLLGVGRHSEVDLASLVTSTTGAQPPAAEAPAHDKLFPAAKVAHKERQESPTRWSSAHQPVAKDAVELAGDKAANPAEREVPNGQGTGCVIVAGTFDTKGKELNFMRDQLRAQNNETLTVDLSTYGAVSSADVPPHHVAACHADGMSKVFSKERGTAVKAMSVAFASWLAKHPGIKGIISAGGSGGTALVTPAMRGLAIGVPKVMVSTVASGEVGQYVGASDIMMMYSVTDVSGINRVSRQILSNAAMALSGMIAQQSKTAPPHDQDKPGVGLTMFGVTTPAVQQVRDLLQDRYECLVFHATGTGGKSMEKLVDSGLLTGVLDLTTTEVCDLHMGGVFPAGEERLDAFIRNQVPYVGSVGALDMVNFGARDTVPEKYADRLFYEHNPQVTLMRTTIQENAALGSWIAGKLNRMEGPVRFVVPEKGISSLDAPGQPFADPAADQALFESLRSSFVPAANRQLIFLPHHINDAPFAQACVDEFVSLMQDRR